MDIRDGQLRSDPKVTPHLILTDGLQFSRQRSSCSGISVDSIGTPYSESDSLRRSDDLRSSTSTWCADIRRAISHSGGAPDTTGSW